jgi:hypothetical protein
MDYLTAEAAKGTYDSVLHVGDCMYLFHYPLYVSPFIDFFLPHK